MKPVALTFDDGPGPHTGRLLDELAARRARATFFDVGRNAAARPALVCRQRDEGHEIGNHSWSHPDLTRLAPGEVRAELDRTGQAIRDATGDAEAPRLLRPPYGAHNAVVRDMGRRMGMPLILWSVDTEDWKYRDTAHVTNAVLGGVRPGAIVLMHDIHATTVAAVPAILDALADDGYDFVTVSELYAGADDLKPGELYYARMTA
ncbi:polysaccharide deacetylase family protein [Streptomyces sp. 6N223]|uniref:polysaccharide deacetylase family protein n=1 Tax=Streptomyces sp. 6N223 TaxID=3457412 RepID=UPI003FD5AB20